MFHCISLIANPPLLEVPDRGFSKLEVPNIGFSRQGSSVQHEGKGLGRRSDLRVMSLVHHRLRYFGLFGPPLELSLLEGPLPYFHHLLALLLLLPFMVCRLRSKRLEGWRGRKLSLGCPSWRDSTSLGLQQLLET